MLRGVNFSGELSVEALSMSDETFAAGGAVDSCAVRSAGCFGLLQADNETARVRTTHLPMPVIID